MDKCPLCEKASEVSGEGPLDMAFKVNCSTCGLFLVTDSAVRALFSEDLRNKRIYISAFLKEQNIKNLPPITLINTENDQINFQPRITLFDAINQFPKKFSDRIDKVLMNLSKLSKHIGHGITILPESDYPTLYVDSQDMDSVFYMIQSLSDLGFVNMDKSTHDGFNLVLTPLGWNRIYELEKKNDKKSNQVFVAMWFHESMDSAWENGFKKGIEDTGFTPTRIDYVEHNNKICDEIIAEIRKSRFVISDFTGHRGGVYFEAGFALGLGIPVIWSCREDAVDELHFDTRQYSHILWKDEKDLWEKIRNRILATIGRCGVELEGR